MPDHWSFFGGAIEKGETPEDAVKRETLEELNYKLKNPKLLMTQELHWKGHEGKNHIYFEKCEDKSGLKLKEGQDWSWFKIEDAKKLKIVVQFKEVLDCLKDKI